jgi:hypothetical protein
MFVSVKERRIGRKDRKEKTGWIGWMGGIESRIGRK